MQAALDLEKHVNESLLDLHKVADKNGDPQVRTNQIPFVAMVYSLLIGLLAYEVLQYYHLYLEGKG